MDAIEAILIDQHKVLSVVKAKGDHFRSRIDRHRHDEDA